MADEIILNDNNSDTIEYIEITNSGLGTLDASGDAVVISEYSANIPIINPPFSAENVANKRFDLTDPNNTTYPSTLAVANAINGSSGLTTAINGLTALGNTVCLGGALTGNTALGGNFTLSLTGDTKLSTDAGYQISGVTMFKTVKSLTNIAIGYNAGYNSLGSGNTYVGNCAGYNETGSNKLYIDNTDTNTPLIYGEFDNNCVKINGSLDVTDGLSISGSTITSTPTEINVLHGIPPTLTAVEIGYIDGITSNIQAQINKALKLAKAGL